MAKKRVHEIAKAQGVSSEELLAALKPPASRRGRGSSVEEADALKAIGAEGDGRPSPTPPTPRAERAAEADAEEAAEPPRRSPRRLSRRWPRSGFMRSRKRRA